MVGWLGAVVGRGILPYRFTGERWPSVFAHATGHSVFRGTAGAREGVEEERGQKSVGHMSPFARSLACPWQDVMLNVEVRG